MKINNQQANFFSFLRRDRQRPGQGRLLRQYFFVSVLLLGGGLITSGLIEVYFRYREAREQIAVIQGEIASSAAQRIAQFILTIEEQMKAATVSSIVARKGIAPEYQFELAKLLSIAPAITEVTAIDAAAHPQAYLSRFRVSPSTNLTNFSNVASFNHARQGVTYFGNVKFLHDAEPSITIAVPIEQFPGKIIGVLEAQVDLRQIWEVVRELKFGDAGYSYIVTRGGELIAHSDLGQVFGRLRLGFLPQVRAAFQPNPVAPKPRTETGSDLYGKEVLSSFVFLPSLEWAVFVEQPLSDAYQTLYDSILRTSVLLLIGLGVALLAAVYVARRVVRPLGILRAGVERIGKGDLEHHLDIKTGDEIEILADEFNKMVGQIKSSYQSLEDKVHQRTKELAALFDVTATCTQSLDINQVLQRVAEKITEIFELDGTRIFLLDRSGREMRVRAIAGYNREGFVQDVFGKGEGIVGMATENGEPIIFEDVQNDPRYSEMTRSGASKRVGLRFFAAFPIKSKGSPVGAIACNAGKPRKLSAEEIRLINSMAEQIGPAIENLDLFEDLTEKTTELELINRELSRRTQELARFNEEINIANERLKELDRLKSGFVSNVSHELKTPLTVIGSLADNMLDGITGPLNEKQTRYMSGIKDSADRLARLIHDVLDLSVIEAGKVDLKVKSFGLPALVHEVIETMRPVAEEKNITIEAPPIDGNRVAWADRDKITQVLTNLIDNALKFTPRGGKVSLALEPVPGSHWLRLSVIDNGPGIPPEEAKRIFDEFYQIHQRGAEKIKGVGLGLAICKKLVDMHGGTLDVTSAPGAGSTFSFTVPARPSLPIVTGLH
ncbi:MAG TPA: ATP-binding protein [Candidatus Binatia bacterium]|nr:ATP-binding protein [Candidatus Binatia bacterium]